MLEKNTLKNIPPRYKLPNGKYESINSYNTFINYYISTDPNPTAKELATLSGFKASTCTTWITKNKYIQRKTEWLQLKENEINKSEIDIKKSINSMLEEIKFNQVAIHKANSENVLNKQSNILKLDLRNPERLELFKETSYLQKDFINLVNGLKAIDEYKSGVSEDSYYHEIIQEAISVRAEVRALSFDEKRKEVEAEYKNIPWE